MTTQSYARLVLGVAVPVAALGFVAAGCATGPKPTLSNARLAVERASESEAPEYAPLELRLARERMQAADEAMEDEDYTEARRLAEKAIVDAQLAEAKAEAGSALTTESKIRKTMPGEGGSPPQGGYGSGGGTYGTGSGAYGSGGYDGGAYEGGVRGGGVR